MAGKVQLKLLEPEVELTRVRTPMLAHVFPLPKAEAAIRGDKDVLDFGVTHGYLSSFKVKGLCCRKITLGVKFTHLPRGEVSDGSVDLEEPHQIAQSACAFGSLSASLLARVVSGSEPP